MKLECLCTRLDVHFEHARNQRLPEIERWSEGQHVIRIFHIGAELKAVHLQSQAQNTNVKDFSVKLRIQCYSTVLMAKFSPSDCPSVWLFSEDNKNKTQMGSCRSTAAQMDYSDSLFKYMPVLILSWLCQDSDIWFVSVLIII